MSLYLRPCTLRKALPFVGLVHRRQPDITGALWAVGVWSGNALVGVAVVGQPKARMLGARGETLEVVRVAVTEGHPNACSMLYGACARAAKAMGADNLVTYTHSDEAGASLRGAGWIEDGMTDGGEWDRDGRKRELAVDPNPKRRWWAPWSKRVTTPHPSPAPAGSAIPTAARVSSVPVSDRRPASSLAGGGAISEGGEGT